MKVKLSFSILLLFICTLGASADNRGPVPEKAYLFSYTTTQDEGRGGLYFAWSTDGVQWHPIGPRFAYVKSDYSSWGSEKRMIDPVLYRGGDGKWHGIWKLNHEDGNTIAHVTTEDYVYWGRQSYYAGMTGVTVLDNFRPDPEWQELNKIFLSLLEKRREVAVNGILYSGSVNEVPWEVLEGILTRYEVASYRDRLWSEKAADDPVRFAGLEPVKVTITPDPAKGKAISDILMGIFFEDINYAADGGLYAELVQNRGFEYALSDKSGWDTTWHARKAWTAEGLGFDIETASPVTPQQQHYTVLRSETPGGKLINEGFGGIPVRSGEKYDFSVFARNLSGNGGEITVRLAGADGTSYGETSIRVRSGNWAKLGGVITATGTADNARLELVPEFTGKIALDMISLFPQNTFRGRKNGLRADLAQFIADMKPQFVRFPGGCVAHGNGLENMYLWQNTVGPLEQRVPQANLWGYHQSGGLGYYEYFQFCEDIGAEPVPVVPAGVPCQNSAAHGHPLGGQQGGIPICDMDDYVQQVLDLIEWANGPANSKWGRVRAAAGHPAPFNLRYLGVGNEDLITDIFEERFNMIFHAVRERYPDITVIGTAGPFFEGTDYVEGWNIAVEQGVPMLDEHYYQTPGWFIYNQDFYDKYDRSKGQVYLGEYAAHLPGRVSNMESALAEAICLTALERNGDVVAMSSYAPLLAKEGYTQWRPDLIYFTNTEVKPTVNYYVQKLFGNNAGDVYIPQSVAYSNDRREVTSRIAVSVVKDSGEGDIIVKMVNMLPVNVNTDLDLAALGVDGASVTVTLLGGGAPDDDNGRPVEKTVALSEAGNMELPPYSLTVLRFTK